MPSFWKRTGWRVQTNATVKKMHTDKYIERVRADFVELLRIVFVLIFVPFVSIFVSHFKIHSRL